MLLRRSLRGGRRRGDSGGHPVFFVLVALAMVGAFSTGSIGAGVLLVVVAMWLLVS